MFGQGRVYVWFWVGSLSMAPQQPGQQNKIWLAKQIWERTLALQEAGLPRNHMETILIVNELGRV